MKVPKGLTRLVEEAYAKKQAEQERENRAYEDRRKAEKEERKRRLSAGLSDAKFIFQWTNHFCFNEVGSKILKLASQSFYRGVMFFDEKLPGQSFRGLGVSLHRVWWIRSGCGASPERVYSPEQLATEIDPVILAAAVARIKSGKVWETIKDRWELKELQ